MLRYGGHTWGNVVAIQARDDGKDFPLVHPDSDPKTQLARNIFANGALPTDISIGLGAAPCNHACMFCPQSVVKPKKATWLDLEVLEKVLREMPEEGIRLNISSYSETLAAPNLVPAVDLMKTVRPKFPIVMATNGTLMREQVIDDLIFLGLDHYQFSFDAPTRESYAKMMQVDHFDRAWKNLETIVEMRNQRFSPMKITTHIMAFEEFREDFEVFKAHWEKKVDEVIFRPVVNWGGEPWNLFKRLAEAGYTPIKGPERPRGPCNSIFMHMELSANGCYVSCLAAALEGGELNSKHLGDAREMTWTEAWSRISDMRQAHLEGRWDDYACCRTCDLWSGWPDVWEDRGENAGDGPRFHINGVEHAT